MRQGDKGERGGDGCRTTPTLYYIDEVAPFGKAEWEKLKTYFKRPEEKAVVHTNEPQPFTREWFERVQESNRFLVEAYEHVKAAREYIPEKTPPLEEALAALLNMYCAENGSDTPDFVLARYLLDCLKAFEVATKSRDEWRFYRGGGDE